MWQEGQDDWHALDELDYEEAGRGAGWKPRREHTARSVPFLDMGMECSRCGCVPTLHSFDALGERPRPPAASGRLPIGSTGSMFEVLSGLLWVGNLAASRMRHLNDPDQGGAVTHVINATEDISNELPGGWWVNARHVWLSLYLSDRPSLFSLPFPRPLPVPRLWGRPCPRADSLRVRG